MEAVQVINDDLPPMLQQYVTCKQEHPDCLVLFQVGDFYEVFFEDAVTVAQTLNLTLTSRDKSSDRPIPMCGVPIAVVDTYLSRLVDAGFSVAIVSQTQPAGLTKGMVPRALERIVTPGLRVLGADTEVPAVLASLVCIDETLLSLAYTDLRHGRVLVRDSIEVDQLRNELEVAGATEVVMFMKTGQGKTLDRRATVVRLIEQVVKREVRWRGESYLTESFGSVPGMSVLSPPLRRAVNLLLNYIGETTISVSSGISCVELGSRQGVLQLDSSARTNLELLCNSRDGTLRGSLFETLNKTVSRSGAYTLRNWLTSPLLSIDEIGRRHEAIRSLLVRRELYIRGREALRVSCDCGRIASRIALGVVSPRELAALRSTLRQLLQFQESVTNQIDESSLIRELLAGVQVDPQVLRALTDFLSDDPPYSVADGNIVREGYHEKLDALRKIQCKSEEWFRQFEANERQRTGISSLKVKRNNVIGYFIEVTKSHLSKVPDTYVKRQSTTSGDRFAVPELQEMQAQIFAAQAQVTELERELFHEFRQSLLVYVDSLRRLDQAVGTLDVLFAFALLAEERGYVEPRVVSSRGIRINKGKHPVLERVLQDKFVANSIELGIGSGPTCFVLTGANMGGKSTYLRQVALLVIMAQIGSFIPAVEAEIGIVDKIFARIGASDNVLDGESTFMVEMREMAAIIHGATERSLVIIDEVGRGTSTHDGYCLARALVEWLIKETCSLTLFATHFYQLTRLASEHPEVANYRVGSEMTADGILFTHEISPGAAEESYGLEVAKRAGFPGAIVERAQSLIVTKQQPVRRNASRGEPSPTPQLGLFASSTTQEDLHDKRERQEMTRKVGQLEKIAQLVTQCDINRTTPLEALQLLSQLSSLCSEGKM